MSKALKQLETLGVILPEAVKPAANYVPYVISGKQVIISGQLPVENGGFKDYVGKLGDDCSMEKAQQAAKLCGINLLAQLADACGGNLDKVKRCVRLGVFVNSTPDFTDHSLVANGVSDFMVDVFGKDIGSHARAAVGVAALPFGVAVEVDGIFEL